MRYYHDQHIGVYENAFSDEWCNNVIEYFEKNIKNSHSRKGIFGGDSVRDTSVNLIHKELSTYFYKIFNKAFSLYEYRYPAISHLGSLHIQNLKIQKTLPTEGYHPYHIEQGNSPPLLWRVGVYTVYLNDVEEGGETEFLYQLKRLKPKKGTLCIFPAGYTHVHRGNTPFSGEKYIMTGWLQMNQKKEVGN